MALIATAIATAAAAKALLTTVNGLCQEGKHAVKVAADDFNNAADMGVVSLPAFTKPLRLCSRVYIDDSVYADPVITDIIKTVHTQYAAFVLAALQMNKFIEKGRTVSSMMQVVATEDMKIHEPVVEGLFGKIKEHYFPSPSPAPSPPVVVPPLTKEQLAQKQHDDKEREDASQKAAKAQALSGKVVSLAGDNHVPAGKILEITLANPDNPEVSVTLNLMVQLAPYRVPEQLAVAMITKDVIPSFFQRYLQWRTGEISFWRDFVAMTDIVESREKLMKMDPTGILAEQIGKQSQGRQRVMMNVVKDKAERSRNIANSVLILGRETVQRAAAESGVNLVGSASGPMGLLDAGARQRFFATSFVMMMVVVDPLYNQVTFYYNGLDDAATFSFDQLQVKNKGDQGLDLVSVMNALGQGRSPKF